MQEKSSDVVFVGNKPPMSYVLALITAFSSGQKEITLKARGQAITTAVDVAEITRSRFIKDIHVSKIAIGTAEMPPERAKAGPGWFPRSKSAWQKSKPRNLKHTQMGVF